MTRFQKLLLVTLGAIALGVQACSSGTELNPQPLPPSDPSRGPAGEKGSADDNGGGAPLPTAADAGGEGGDAADAARGDR